MRLRTIVINKEKYKVPSKINFQGHILKLQPWPNLNAVWLSDVEDRSKQLKIAIRFWPKRSIHYWPTSLYVNKKDRKDWSILIEFNFLDWPIQYSADSLEELVEVATKGLNKLYNSLARHFPE